MTVIIAVTSTSCTREPKLPTADTPQYRDFVSAFYVGLAGLQTGEDTRAKSKLGLASQLIPGEPASWADLALLSARQQDFDAAFNFADKARQLAPENGRVEALVGLIESQRGRLPEAIAHLKKAVELEPGNLKSNYALAEQTERQAAANSDAEAQKLYEQTLRRSQENLAVELDVARLAAKRGDAAALKLSLDRITATSAAWPDEAHQRLTMLRQAADGPNPRAAAVQVAFLRNVLARVPAYRQSLNAVKTPSAFVGEPFVTFLRLPTPDSQPAPIDTGLTFTTSTPAGVPNAAVSWTGAIPLDETGRMYFVTASTNGVTVSSGAHLPTPGPIGRHGIIGADLNYDFKTDLVIAGERGVKLYQQQSPDRFTDIAPTSKLPAAVLNAAYTGAWAFDIDLDGDLDIVLGAPSADSTVLRNNGDGTFALIHPFPGLSGVVGFASADIDGDGDPDVVLIDTQGALHVFSNERLGQYRPRALPDELKGRFVEVAAGDVNGDGMPDFVALRDDGSVMRLSDKNHGAAWDTHELIPPGGSQLTTATANLILADFDNNGALDILAGNRLFLADAHTLTPVTIPAGLTLTSAVDLNNDGRLDLIGAAQTNPIQLAAHPTKNYNWQTLRVRSAKAVGDQRINSFGIGGEVEIRSGLLAQKQVIASPVLHFGLGTHPQTDVARIVWPNGSVQAEFELKADQSLLAEQRLKGSCPFLFAWDGKQMRFVKDGEPWSPALGLRINAQAVARIDQTSEWFKVPGESLVPRDGYYDLRVTAELWENFYIDHYSLITVDHPAGTEIFTDERFSVPSPALKIYTVSTPQPFLSAHDDRGQDVGALVSQVDQTYLDTFGRGRYQGVTRDHWVELELPASAPQSGPLYLIGTGWMHPTDGTVNVALGQSSDAPPQGLSIEVPNANGKWTVAKSGLGFLAGRNKTAVLDISTIFRAGASRKLRLRTNLEIYWDQLAWAAGVPDTNTHTQRAALTQADLQYRGFSQVSVANASSPEIPNYNRLAGTAQKWRDLEGYCTRFGDVRELLDRVDDRIVITNAGDELRLRFAELAPPPSGWKRDFVMVGDGWIKDGDYNSLYSKTVLPLPYHAMKDYNRAPSTLENEPAYKLHPEDWQRYQTRYITPERFLQALWN